MNIRDYFHGTYCHAHLAIIMTPSQTTIFSNVMRSSGNSVRYEGLACCVVSTFKKEIAGIINNYLFVCGLHSLCRHKLEVSKICAVKIYSLFRKFPLDLGEILVCCVYCNCDRQLTCLIV